MISMAHTAMEEDEIQAVTDVLKSGRLCEGEKCATFSEDFAKLVGAKHATVFSNGTTALHTAYLNLFEPGDEVLVPAFTFFATAAMIVRAGGIPVFCDIDKKTFCLDVADAERKITPKTRAIAPVHLFGNACDIEKIQALAKAHDLKIIWDAAQAHLTKYKGADIGSFGDAVCYSFYATKNMTTGGEGGMITSDNEEFIKKCILLKRQGQAKKYYHTVVGTNYRMTDMQGAIGIRQVKKITGRTARRRRNADILNEGLKDIPGITTPFVEPFVEHCYHHYTILIDEKLGRDNVIKTLADNDIGHAINYPTPLHLQPAFEPFTKNITSLPAAEKISSICLSLPIHHALQDSDVYKIVDCFKTNFKR